MIALLQRVSEASVHVNQTPIARIGEGLLALIAIQRGDDSKTIEKLADRVLGYRLFTDESGRMNRSLMDIQGELLAVPQFTLAADTGRGLRPSFTPAAPPDIGRNQFQALLEAFNQRHPRVQSGEFGADMQVHLINNGPVTFWLEVPPDPS